MSGSDTPTPPAAPGYDEGRGRRGQGGRPEAAPRKRGRRRRPPPSSGATRRRGRVPSPLAKAGAAAAAAAAVALIVLLLPSTRNNGGENRRPQHTHLHPSHQHRPWSTTTGFFLAHSFRVEKLQQHKKRSGGGGAGRTKREDRRDGIAAGPPDADIGGEDDGEGEGGSDAEDEAEEVSAEEGTGTASGRRNRLSLQGDLLSKFAPPDMRVAILEALGGAAPAPLAKKNDNKHNNAGDGRVGSKGKSRQQRRQQGEGEAADATASPSSSSSSSSAATVVLQQDGTTTTTTTTTRTDITTGTASLGTTASKATVETSTGRKDDQRRQQQRQQQRQQRLLEKETDEDGFIIKTFPDTRPNLLFIVCDQLRYDAVAYAQRRIAPYRNKLKVRTPNVDRIAAGGAQFATSYCVSPSCAPSRAAFMTGTSIHRTGILGNKMVSNRFRSYQRHPLTRMRVASSTTFEQVLAGELGYNVDYYGKFHTPREYAYYADVNSSQEKVKRNAIEYNDYDFQGGAPTFDPKLGFKRIYQRALGFLLKRDRVDGAFGPGQQRNSFTGRPYTPIRIDPRFGRKTNTPLSSRSGFKKWQIGNSNIAGRDSLDPRHTPTGVLGQMAARALDRLILQRRERDEPFSLSVHFNAPHPPIVATSAYLQYYWTRRNNIKVPPTLRERNRNSAYADTRKRLRANKSDFSQIEISQLTAVYYAMIEEVDNQIGVLLNKLEAGGQADNTLVIFTSDHGEMLGAHGRLGKGNFHEEAARVPMAMMFPGRIPAGTIVKEPVSHIDIYSTILDYLQVDPKFDKSDGKSLRRYVDRRSYNREYDEEVVVAQLENLRAKSSGKDGGDGIPNYMVRHGFFKLTVPKKADLGVIDMMYNLRLDPYETKNLIGMKGMQARSKTIGKAEHLKALLVEWMKRNNGERKYYTDSKYNTYVSTGAMWQVRKRRTWRRVNYWESDSQLGFGKPVKVKHRQFRRNEYLYVGRTTPGKLTLTSIVVKGPHSRFFKLSKSKAIIHQNGYVRIKIAFHSRSKVWKHWNYGLQAYIEIRNDANGIRRIQLYGK